MRLSEVTPLIITYNEEANIGRVLERLQWAQRVLIVDSYSSDSTEQIAKSFENVQFIQNRFENFAQQCNFGLGLVKTKWVLSIDADYVCSEALVREISALEPAEIQGFRTRFDFLILAKKIPGTLLPPRTVLFRTESGHYVMDGHAHQLVLKGSTSDLDSHIAHDDRKPLSRWCESQIGYARKEAEKLLSARFGELSKADRIRRLPFVAPPMVFVFSLIRCKVWRAPRPVVYYALQRLIAEWMLQLFLLDRRILLSKRL